MSDLFQNIVEIGFGLLYLVGAIFNVLYTLRHGDEFYGSFAEKAWLAFVRPLIRKVVIPHARFFTGALIVFQLLVAVLILSRGAFVEVGLLVGVAFCFSVVFASNVPGALANLVMAVVQLYLALTR
jgi:hypothetical protein